MDSLSPILSITQEEFNAFHSYDMTLFFCLVITLRRDIRQSYQIMSFLLYVVKTAHNLSNLIANFASSLDAVVNMVADHVVCVPAFVDIHVRAEMYYREIEARGRAIARRNQMGIGSFLQKGESGGRRFSGGPQRGTNGGRGNANDRTIFLSFSRGYPVTRAELHGYFTWRLGAGSIEAIHMGGAGGIGQALHAAMVLSSPSKIPEILIEGLTRTKYTINGKHVWARKLIPSNNPSSYNNYPCPHSHGNFF